tara:strand:+ start:195 stop:1007 length:813 start_codon:yes stop_codon:yes gene_type:complete
MIFKRLTKIQRQNILEGYLAGESANDLANKYNCSPNTVNRTVKALVSEDEYTLLKGKRSKVNRSLSKQLSSEINNNELEDSVNLLDKAERSVNIKKSLKDEYIVHEKEATSVSLSTEPKDNFIENVLTESQVQAIKTEDDISQQNINEFEEIAPLETNLGCDVDKNKINIKELDYEILPESVYMIVDKKVELDSQAISSLPEWDFLPEDELNRQAILLFSTQRSAKRSCSKTQRVIKIPNTKVFLTTKSFLLSKGITRLICEDSLISLSK